MIKWFLHTSLLGRPLFCMALLNTPPAIFMLSMIACVSELYSHLLISGLVKISMMLILGVYYSITAVNLGVVTTTLSIVAPIFLD